MKEILRRAEKLLASSDVVEFNIDKGRTVYINIVVENGKRIISAIEVSDDVREYPEIEDYLFDNIKL